MDYEIKEGVAGEFAKKGEDIKDGDKVTIKNEGEQISGQYGIQDVFKILTENGELNANFNQTSINAIVKEFGKSSSSWIDKEVIVHAIKQNVSGKFLDVYYFVPEGYVMGERGFDKGNVPTVDLDKEDMDGKDEVDVSKVPF